MLVPSGQNDDRSISLAFSHFFVSQSAVTALRFNAASAMLASGAKDTDVILWDVVGETGMFRLRGHHDQARALPDA